MKKISIKNLLIDYGAACTRGGREAKTIKQKFIEQCNTGNQLLKENNDNSILL